MTEKAPLALVTGASGGIGRAISIKLASEGCDLMIHYCRNRKAAEQLSDLIKRQYNCCCTVFQADFTCIEETADKVDALQCAPDILVHNSGIAANALFQDETMEAFALQLAVGLTAPALLTKVFLPGMISRKHGKIIVISSIWGLTGAACEVTYSMVKGGQNAFVKALAKEAAPSGIQVNGVAPGAINTGMLKHYSDEDLTALQDEIPDGRIGNPEDVAEAAAFLASDKASYINGQILSVNGAWHC